MQKDLKDKWVAALRSGEYTQTKKFLKNEEGFCCLGVLLEVEKVVVPDIDPDGDYFYEGSTKAPSYWEIPHKEICNLMNMNDRHGKTFAEIADYIEENL